MSDDDKGGSAPSGASDAPPAAALDIAMIGEPTEHGVQILRMREGHVELGELRALQEGKPILGESVRLRAREDRPGLYDVETVARGPLARKPQEAAALPARKGPAKVASDAYRSGWDSILQRKRDKGELPN